MVLAPRHPQRFPEVERLLKASGMEFEKKSQTNGRSYSDGRTSAFWIPWGIFKNFMRLEILRLWAGAWSMQEGIICWSLPAFDRPVLFGPYMANFAAIAEEMKEKEGELKFGG